MRFVVEVIITGGGLSEFLGACFSDNVFSVPVGSVSLSIVLRGAKIMRETLFLEAA